MVAEAEAKEVVKDIETIFPAIYDEKEGIKKENSDGLCCHYLDFSGIPGFILNIHAKDYSDDGKDVLVITDGKLLPNIPKEASFKRFMIGTQLCVDLLKTKYPNGFMFVYGGDLNSTLQLDGTDTILYDKKEKKPGSLTESSQKINYSDCIVSVAVSETPSSAKTRVMTAQTHSANEKKNKCGKSVETYGDVFVCVSFKNDNKLNSATLGDCIYEWGEPKKSKSISDHNPLSTVLCEKRLTSFNICSSSAENWGEFWPLSWNSEEQKTKCKEITDYIKTQLTIYNNGILMNDSDYIILSQRLGSDSVYDEHPSPDEWNKLGNLLLKNTNKYEKMNDAELTTAIEGMPEKWKTKFTKCFIGKEATAVAGTNLLTFGLLMAWKDAILQYKQIFDDWYMLSQGYDVNIARDFILKKILSSSGILLLQEGNDETKNIFNGLGTLTVSNRMGVKGKTGFDETKPQDEVGLIIISSAASGKEETGTPEKGLFGNLFKGGKRTRRRRNRKTRRRRSRRGRK